MWLRTSRHETAAENDTEAQTAVRNIYYCSSGHGLPEGGGSARAGAAGTACSVRFCFLDTLFFCRPDAPETVLLQIEYQGPERWYSLRRLLTCHA